MHMPDGGSSHAVVVSFVVKALGAEVLAGDKK